MTRVDISSSAEFESYVGRAIWKTDKKRVPSKNHNSKIIKENNHQGKSINKRGKMIRGET